MAMASPLVVVRPAANLLVDVNARLLVAEKTGKNELGTVADAAASPDLLWLGGWRLARYRG
jgi:hypothetical protein